MLALRSGIEGACENPSEGSRGGRADLARCELLQRADGSHLGVRAAKALASGTAVTPCSSALIQTVLIAK